MRHMRRTAFAPLAAALMGLGLLAGCGGTAPTAAAPNGAQATPPAEQATAPAGQASHAPRNLTEDERLDLAQLVKMVSRAVAYTYDSEPPAGNVAEAAQADPKALGTLMSNVCYLQAERLKMDAGATDTYANVYGISWVSNGDSILMPTREAEKLMTSCFGTVPAAIEDVDDRRIVKGEGGWTIYPSNTYTRETVQLGAVDATESRVECDISITYVDSGLNASDKDGEGTAEFTYHVVAVPDDQSVYGFHLVDMRSTGHTVIGGFTAPEEDATRDEALAAVRDALLYYGEIDESDQVTIGHVSEGVVYIIADGRQYLVDTNHFRVLNTDGSSLN